ncbi:MAG: hypothetical protein AABZ44_00475 [Elusimicrobiota bacterium]
MTQRSVVIVASLLLTALPCLADSVMLMRAPLEYFEGVRLVQDKDLAFELHKIKITRGMHPKNAARASVTVDLTGRWVNKSFYQTELAPKRLILESPQMPSPVHLKLLEARGVSWAPPKNHFLEHWQNPPLLEYRAVGSNRILTALAEGSEFSARLLVRITSGLSKTGYLVARTAALR